MNMKKSKQTKNQEVKQTPRQKLADIFSKYKQKTLTTKQEIIRTKNNITTINRRFKKLERQIGRKLTSDEEDEVLTIVDKYTPMGRDGHYLLEPLPFDYAWKIYQTKKEIKLDRFLNNLEID